MKLPIPVGCLFPPGCGNVNNKLRPEKLFPSCFRTGVRFPSAPPNRNPASAGFPIWWNQAEGNRTYQIKLPVAAWMPPAGRGHHHNVLESPRLHRPGQQRADRVGRERGDLNLFNQAASGSLDAPVQPGASPQCPRFPSAPPPRITGSR